LRTNIKAVLVVFLLTFLLTISITVISKSVLQYIGLEFAVISLFLIMLLGVIFDIIGVAAAAAVEGPFNAMAANRVFGATTALRLVRSADKVASFCNDVVGDICGTVSGALVISVLFRFLQDYPTYSSEGAMLSVFATGFVAALTVAGKALGKSFAIHRSTNIILFTGKMLASIEKLTGLTVFNGENTKSEKSRKHSKYGK
jgi:hypothetical protein